MKTWKLLTKGGVKMNIKADFCEVRSFSSSIEFRNFNKNDPKGDDDLVMAIAKDHWILVYDDEAQFETLS